MNAAVKTMQSESRAQRESGATGGEGFAVVRIPQGVLRGRLADGIYSFKGIPYAAPPFGPNRQWPPRPAGPWAGVRDALEFGPKSPQLPYPPPIDVLLPESCVSGEDCLNLNVWTRDLGSARQPVLVWISGGMYEYHGTGASPWYDGSRFARDGAVCVTINYRVGAEGFLYLDDGIANLGLQDQVAALEWVRDNITLFGGDPDNVTIFGESAGAMSVATLLAMPRTEGLFRRAICQSGAAHNVSSAATALRVGNYLALKLGVAPSREAIAACPINRVLLAQAELRKDLQAQPDPDRWGIEIVTSMLPWEPAVDGDTIPDRPFNRIAAGAGKDIGLMVGTNTDEHRLFLAIAGDIERVTTEALAAAIALYGLPVKPAVAAYRAAYPGATPGDLLAAIQTDWYWRIPAIRLADAHAKTAKVAPTYMYEFAWRSPQFNGRIGACHSMEIPFVFDTLGNSSQPLLGPNPPQALADTMHAAWIAFAARGEPGWSAYDLSDRATMRFDAASRVEHDPRRFERKLWEAAKSTTSGPHPAAPGVPARAANS